MSKSKGNVINPIDIVEKYGADALRFALVMSTTAGKDSNTGDNKIRGMRNFTNKLWNAARFVKDFSSPKDTKFDKTKAHSMQDEIFYKELKLRTETITKQLNELKVGLAAETLYNEFWHWFCDKYIEEAKEGRLSTAAINKGLETFLILLHPFMPFITEEIWELLGKEKLLITTSWPKTK